MLEHWAVISIDPTQIDDSVLSGVHFLSSDTVRFYDTFKEAFQYFQTLNGNRQHLIIKKDELKMLSLTPKFFTSRKN